MNIELIGSTTEIDTNLKLMNVFNNIMGRMNTRFNLENKLTLLTSPTENDSVNEIMILCNHIFDAIGSLIPFDYKVESTSDIDSIEEIMNAFNRIISTLQGLGNILV